MNYPNGLLLPQELQKKCREAFCFVDADEKGNKRLFFDNSGGAVRVSPLHCHSEADIDEFLRVTAAIVNAVKSRISEVTV